MGKDKVLRQSQANKIGNYTQVTMVVENMAEIQKADKQDGHPLWIDPGLTLADVMEAIKRTRMELATKINLVTIDVNLICADLHPDRVTNLEEMVGTLQRGVAALKQTIVSSNWVDSVLRPIGRELVPRDTETLGSQRRSTRPRKQNRQDRERSTPGLTGRIVVGPEGTLKLASTVTDDSASHQGRRSQHGLYADRAVKMEDHGDAFLLEIMLPTLNAEDRAMLDKPITLEEIKAAIRKLTTTKTLGGDGLPAEIYQHYKGLLAEKLLEVLQEAQKTGRTPDSMQEAFVVLIPKPDKDSTEPSSNRPLSLLNADAKILSSVLAV
ncbi:hypothetical protein NDU88_001240 [Pleurodeles waltl]|uniref:Uncharacterized protein n=1 Tax=Pleurodeles waltl TaxID=8319 RepID=A0AAV7R803_PLEWA|nr:hypothetical protein NDU88_001240 [Pleurodeles waltl]